MYSSMWVVEICSQSTDVWCAWQALDWLKEQEWWNFGVQDYNLLVTAYGKLGQPEKAESSISMMRDSGLEPNVAILTSLLEAYARMGNFIQAETILTQMLEAGPAPTEVTYQTYINMLCKVLFLLDETELYSCTSKVNLCYLHHRFGCLDTTRFSKVSGSRTYTYDSIPTSCRIWNAQLVREDKQTWNVPLGIFSIISGDHEYL